MSDIIDRLVYRAAFLSGDDFELITESAREIESLRAQLAEAQASRDTMTREAVARAQEAGELAARLAEIERQAPASVADICNAYESGVGHRGRPTANVNPYKAGSQEHEAYAIGATGEMAAQDAPDALSFPRRNVDGWTIDPEYLLWVKREIETNCADFIPDMEEIQNVLIALEVISADKDAILSTDESKGRDDE